jgi:PmbA protein
MSREPRGAGTPGRRPPPARGSQSEDPREVLAALTGAGLTSAEVYTKRGRARRVELRGDELVFATAGEQGWAVRAGDRHGAFFRVGAGASLPLEGWPEPVAPPLVLPERQPVPAFSPPADLDAPLIGESEAAALLAGVARELDRELPGARLVAAAIDDGASSSALRNANGLEVSWRGRVASLWLEAHYAPGGRGGGFGTHLYTAAREARRLAPLALARRLADRLAVAAAPRRAWSLAAGEVVLDPAVGTAVLAALAPLFVGPQAERRRVGLVGEDGLLAARALSVIEDGRLPGGLLASAVDGEGVPARRSLLLDRGRALAPLLDFRAARERPGSPSSGCMRRFGFRDLPSLGPTHLYVVADEERTVASLLAEVRAGAYLLELTSGVVADPANDRLELTARGFELAAGRAVSPLPVVRVTGSLRQFLRGVVAVGRDLAFFPLGGMIGTPTLVVEGLALAAD